MTGYKGQAEVDAGWFYCPYVPIYRVVRGERKVFFIDTHDSTPPRPTTELQKRIMEMVQRPTLK